MLHATAWRSREARGKPHSCPPDGEVRVAGPCPGRALATVRIRRGREARHTRRGTASRIGPTRFQVSTHRFMAARVSSFGCQRPVGTHQRGARRRYDLDPRLAQRQIWRGADVELRGQERYHPVPVPARLHALAVTSVKSGARSRRRTRRPRTEGKTQEAPMARKPSAKKATKKLLKKRSMKKLRGGFDTEMVVGPRKPSTLLKPTS